MKKFLKILRYKLEYYFFLSLIFLLQKLSIDRAASVCAYLTRFIGPFLSVTKIAERNLKLVFPHLSNKKKEKLIQGIWDNYGRFIGEFAHINILSKEDIESRVQLYGVEHLEKIMYKKPFFLCTGHFANWEIALKKINYYLPPIGLVYRKANNPFVDQYIVNSRQHDNHILIPKGPTGSTKLIKALKKNYCTIMLMDQKLDEGIAVPFFNEPVMTAQAIALLSLKFNCPIFPTQVVRKNGSNFNVIIHPALEIKPTGDHDKDIYNILLNINQTLERWVLEHPEQWLWFHRRWKK